MLIEADPVGFGPADVAREIAAVVKAHEAEGTTYDLILLGNDAADTGDFQVGIRLAYELGRPVVNGVRTVEVDRTAVATARGDGIDGVETFEVPLPAVVTVLEGGVEPRYPTITGPDEGQEDPDRDRRAAQRAARLRTGAAHAAARPAQHGRRARRGPRRRGRGRRPAAAPGGGPMILVFVETARGRRHRGVARDGDVRALARRADRRARCTPSSSARCPRRSPTQLGAYGVAEVHHAVGDAFSAYAGAAWAAAVQAACGRRRRRRRARRPAPRAAWRCSRTWPPGSTWRWRPTSSAIGATDPLVVTRQVQGGAVLEEMRLPERPAVLTVAGHAVEADPGRPAPTRVVREHSPEVAAADLLARVVSTEPAGPDESGALTSARVVVGAGRGAGGADGFDGVVELAELLDGALGVSRVVTSLGWRPHHEQIGQTGSRISPELYIPCGISGAIQHWAGCSSSKTILAINTDENAPMVTKATYAVIGDMAEVVPAINAEIRTAGMTRSADDSGPRTTP